MIGSQCVSKPYWNMFAPVLCFVLSSSDQLIEMLPEVNVASVCPLLKKDVCKSLDG